MWFIECNTVNSQKSFEFGAACLWESSQVGHAAKQVQIGRNLSRHPWHHRGPFSRHLLPGYRHLFYVFRNINKRVLYLSGIQFLRSTIPQSSISHPLLLPVPMSAPEARVFSATTASSEGKSVIPHKITQIKYLWLIAPYTCHSTVQCCIQEPI